VRGIEQGHDGVYEADKLYDRRSEKKIRSRTFALSRPEQQKQQAPLDAEKEELLQSTTDS